MHCAETQWHFEIKFVVSFTLNFFIANMINVSMLEPIRHTVRAVLQLLRHTESNQTKKSSTVLPEFSLKRNHSFYIGRQRILIAISEQLIVSFKLASLISTFAVCPLFCSFSSVESSIQLHYGNHQVPSK